MNANFSVSTTDAVSAAGVSLSYGASNVLDNIDMALQRGRTLALLGPSGCGKTTLLRLVAGLLTPDSGSISIDGRMVAGPGGKPFVPPEKRGLGMVFQDYALWPHLSIARNVAFPLEMRGVNRADRERRVEAALARVGLAGFGARNPADLSGGQQQRVAIARAIVGEPDIVLLDEPLSNLDRELRETMVGEIAQLVANLGLTVLYVTHDHGEAFTLADEVAVMRAGHIVQRAAPEALAAHPASPEIAEFLKLGSLIPAERRADGWYLPQSGMRLPDPGRDGLGTRARVLLARNAVAAADPARSALTGTVIRSQFFGHGHAVTVRLGQNPDLPEVQLTLPRRAAPGEIVGLAIEPALLRWFPAQS